MKLILLNVLLVSVALDLACRIGVAAEVPRYVAVANYDAEKAGARVDAILGAQRIRGFIAGGSLGVTISVPADRAAEARQLLAKAIKAEKLELTLVSSNGIVTPDEVLEPKKARQGSRSLKIISARYGVADRRVDVADAIGPLVTHGQVRLQAPWALGLVDPAFGTVKDVQIVYRLGHMKRTATFTQHEDIILPISKEQGRRGDPVGLRLTGRAEKNGQSWQFEVVTEGSDCYYRKEWSGKEERRDVEGTGFWRVSLIDGDFGGARSNSWSEFGVRGGGNSGKNGKDQAELARRLWTGNRFTGVAPDKLRTALESDHYIEEFDVPVSPDRFSVPCVIRWTDNTSAMPKKTTIYTVEKVEFRYDRDPQFFKAVKARYFPKDEDGKHTPIPR